ncbi:hypothetical protein CGRA01v4_05078 [Colletotrichum graminicola]|nr:hypothetical protein CGRA01v4_05078 [Colletotrichum graminicola]
MDIRRGRSWRYYPVTARCCLTLQRHLMTQLVIQPWTRCDKGEKNCKRIDGTILGGIPGDLVSITCFEAKD